MPAIDIIDCLDSAQQRSVVLTPALSILRQHLKNRSNLAIRTPIPPALVRAGRNPGSFRSSWIAIARDSESVLKTVLSPDMLRLRSIGRFQTPNPTNATRGAGW